MVRSRILRESGVHVATHCLLDVLVVLTSRLQSWLGDHNLDDSHEERQVDNNPAWEDHGRLIKGQDRSGALGSGRALSFILIVGVDTVPVFSRATPGQSHVGKCARQLASQRMNCAASNRARMTIGHSIQHVLS